MQEKNEKERLSKDQKRAPNKASQHGSPPVCIPNIRTAQSEHLVEIHLAMQRRMTEKSSQ